MSNKKQNVFYDAELDAVVFDKEITSEIRSLMNSHWQHVGHDLVAATEGDYDEAVEWYQDTFYSKVHQEYGSDLYDELKPLLDELYSNFNG